MVVFNDSADDGAECAAKFGERFERRGWHLRVVETDVPGKWHALNLGLDEVPGRTVTFLCDADVVPAPDALWRLEESLLSCDLALASATPAYPDSASGIVRSYARCYRASPYLRSGDVVPGLFALDRRALESLRRFPDSLADDRYLTIAVDPSLRLRIPNARIDYPFPDSPIDLLRQQARWARGNRQIDLRYPDLAIDHAPRHQTQRRPYFGGTRQRPRDVAVYLAVRLLAEVGARFGRSQPNAWR